MTLVSAILLGGYRESNAIPLGAAMTPNQSTEALDVYNDLISALYGGDVGENLDDWAIGKYERDPNGCEWWPQYTDHRLHHPPINQRLIAVNEAAVTLWLTPRPQDGSRMGLIDPFNRLSTVPITLEGNGRPIEGAASIVLNTDGMNVEWIYHAELGGWLKMTGLIATDMHPFPKRFDAMFKIMLAQRLDPRYGRDLSPLSIDTLKSGRRDFIAKYLQSRPLDIDDSISWPFMSRQGYDTQRAFSSNVGFKRGTYPG